MQLRMDGSGGIGRFAALLIIGSLGLATTVAAGAEDFAAKFAGFVRSAAGLDPAVQDRVIASFDPADPGSIADALALGWPEFGRAVDSASRGDSAGARQLAAFVGDQTRPVLAAEAAWQLARVSVAAERYEEAIPMLDLLRKDLSDWTSRNAEAWYFAGICELGLLHKAEADASFLFFLENFQDAPERLRVTAWQLLQELRAGEQNPMAPVTARMEYSRRRLDISEPGADTQREQDEIVRLLATMIEEQQKKECSSGSCNKSGQKQQQQQQAQNQQRPPQENSRSQVGGNSNVANGQATDRTYDNGEASPWSRLRDRARDPANAAIRERLPERYREIVERYSDAVSGNAPGGNDR